MEPQNEYGNDRSFYVIFYVMILIIIAAIIGAIFAGRAWEREAMTKKYHLQHCTVGLHWSQCHDGTVLTDDEKQSNALFVAEMIANNRGTQ